MERRLRVVSEPSDDHVPVLSASSSANPGFVFMWHTGDLNLRCGGCGALLCRNIKEGQIKGVVLQCPKCGKYNQT